jgi:hypothetical protein
MLTCLTWRPVLDRLNELRRLEAASLIAVRAQRLQRQPDERRDDDEREERAAEETIHVAPAEGTSGMPV